jgi:LysM repeat protein
LYGIAQEYGLTVEELRQLNNLTKGQVIYPGQKLLVNSKRAQ